MPPQPPTTRREITTETTMAPLLAAEAALAEAVGQEVVVSRRGRRVAQVVGVG
jgi:hypothetical protein